MKHFPLRYFTILFFLTVHLQYFWQYYLGLIGAAISLFLGIAFLALFAAMLFQFYKAVRERFAYRRRIINIVLILVVLVVTYFFPSGVVDFKQFESPAILTAYQEGTANCSKTVELKADGKFIEKDICFALSKAEGSYTKKGQTLLLHYDDKHESKAVLKEVGKYKMLLLYHDMKDTVPYPMKIIYPKGNIGR
jgi:hypothetical protein